jgi:4-amino-4-deoxy-L-arabinose transferase-like glycosyltransferase
MHRLLRLGFETGKAPAWILRATWCFVALGLIARVVRFLVNYPLWPDEAFVAANFLERGYGDLLRPLDYCQVCPILFLWIELTTVRLFGFAEWSLRLFPTLCSLASVVLFWHLARRLVRGIPLLLAVGIFATSLCPIRHGAEVKPYASDLLAALILMTLAVEWWRAPRHSRYWWILAGGVPIVLAMSYPAVFVATGLGIALATAVFRQKRRSVRWAYAVYNVAMIAAFLVIYFAFTSGQSAAVRLAYRWGYWRDSFPPWNQPWKLPGWLVLMHTGNMMSYPIGGANGASAATFVVVAVGILAFWRRGQRTTLGLLLSPLAMGLAASSLGRYPYGGTARIMLYAAPSICVLAGVGGAALIARMRSPALSGRSLRLAGALLAFLGFYFIVTDLARPYRTFEDHQNRRFARWFWSEYGRDSDLLCARCDLGMLFQPKDWRTGMSALYVCNQRIYSRQNGATRPLARMISGAESRPVRLVFFDRVPEGVPSYERWCAEMSDSYRIGKRTEFVVNPDSQAGDKSRYVVVELIPTARQDQLTRSADSDQGRLK